MTSSDLCLFLRLALLDQVFSASIRNAQLGGDQEGQGFKTQRPSMFDEDVIFEFECEHDTSFSSGNWTLSFQPVPGLKTDGWLTIRFAFRISRDGGFGPLLELEVAFKVDP